MMNCFFPLLSSFFLAFNEEKIHKTIRKVKSYRNFCSKKKFAHSMFSETLFVKKYAKQQKPKRNEFIRPTHSLIIYNVRWNFNKFFEITFLLFWLFSHSLNKLLVARGNEWKSCFCWGKKLSEPRALVAMSIKAELLSRVSPPSPALISNDIHMLLSHFYHRFGEHICGFVVSTHRRLVFWAFFYPSTAMCWPHNDKVRSGKRRLDNYRQHVMILPVCNLPVILSEAKSFTFMKSTGCRANQETVECHKIIFRQIFEFQRNFIWNFVQLRTIWAKLWSEIWTNFIGILNVEKCLKIPNKSLTNWRKTICRQKFWVFFV